MTTPLGEVTLRGRLSTWQVRTDAVTGTPVWVAWLSHAGTGTLGVALISAALPSYGRQRCVVTGTIQPRRVSAHADDPRTADDPTQAPVVLHVTAMAHRQESAPPCGGRWPVGPSVWQGRYYQAAVVPSPGDLYVLAAPGQHTAGTWPWHQLYGLVHLVQGQRYLRYLGVPETLIGGRHAG
ncbi:MAG: hypothetical protein HC828_05615 [Blastochloris sp.]|nr:hypothetical protein [Blastochloris sp.]